MYLTEPNTCCKLCSCTLPLSIIFLCVSLSSCCVLLLCVVVQEKKVQGDKLTVSPREHSEKNQNPDLREWETPPPERRIMFQK